MEKVLSIFCCGEQEEEHPHTQKQQPNARNMGSNSTNSSNSNNNKHSTTTTNNSNNNNNNNNNSRGANNMKKDSLASKNQHQQESEQQAKQQQSDASSKEQHDMSKTDVQVYEATDSTVETGDNQQQQHQGVTGTADDTPGYTHQASLSTSTNTDVEDNGGEDEDVLIDEDEEVIDDFFDLTKLQPGQTHASSGWLLDPAPAKFKSRKCLILDLDETLVHSSFKYMRHADFVIPVDIDNQLHNVYVIKRPGVDEFMKRVGEIYEVVVFTASVNRYGDPLLDALDIHHSVHHRLFRDSCYNYQGNYIKNLSQIGRPLNEIIILDNSPASYIFHPQHAIPISSWFSDAHDNELLDIIPFLEDLAKDNVEDIGLVLDINV